MPKGSKTKVFYLSLILMAFCIGLILFQQRHGFGNAEIKAFETSITISEEKTNADKYEDSVLRAYAADASLKFKDPVSATTSEDLSAVHANNAITVDITNDEILFERHARKRVPVASLTKIMTAIVALEHMDLKDEIIVSEKAGETGENSMGLSSFEVYSLEELLYGLILHSGNDAAVAIAEGTAKTEEDFVEWMNIKASELGLEDTKFADASGLNDATYSTAYDMAKLTKYALKNPDFKEIVATIEYEVPYVEGKHKYLFLSNQTNLLRTYPGVKGVKTGYTEEANLCLVTYADNEGVEIVGVVLDSDARRSDMVRMLDYSYAKRDIYIDHPLLTL